MQYRDPAWFPLLSPQVFLVHAAPIPTGSGSSFHAWENIPFVQHSYCTHLPEIHLHVKPIF
jgi:hypothetical protein